MIPVRNSGHDNSKVDTMDMYINGSNRIGDGLETAVSYF